MPSAVPIPKTGRRARRHALIRAGVGIALLLAVVVVAVIMLSGGTTARFHLRMENASQLVKGDLVEVGGLGVGTVAGIDLTDDNEADVSIKVTDEKLLPLHRGTRAFVRVPSASGVANRYVALQPGPNSAPKLHDGAVIPAADTTPSVDLDAVQATLDADTRARLRSLIHGAADAYTAGSSRGLNEALRYFDPALGQLDSTLGELVADRPALQRFIVASSSVVSAVASRQGDLEHGLASAATTAGALASERRSLQRALAAAPAALGHAGRTLQSLASTLDQVTPTAQAARPVAPRLSRVLTLAAPTLQRGAVVLPRLRAVLEPLRAALAGLPALRGTTVPALRAATTAIVDAMPIVAGTRPYTPDAILGATNGFGGTAAGYYDANGAYARIAAVAGPFSIAGLGSTLPIPNVNVKYGNVNRCPGAATQVAPDGSNKFDGGVPCKESQRP